VFDNALTEAFHTCKKDIKKSPQRASLFRQAFMDMVDIWIEATLCIVPKERAERLQEGADEWKLNIINKFTILTFVRIVILWAMNFIVSHLIIIRPQMGKT
jgi:hypothetical protein